MKTMRSEGGFTLIELMIVVLIIGILVAIAIPVFTNVQANAAKRACQANQRSVDGAIQSYAAGNDGAYPADTAGMWTALVPEYIQTRPACPSTGAYSAVAGGTSDMHMTCSIAGHPYR